MENVCGRLLFHSTLLSASHSVWQRQWLLSALVICEKQWNRLGWLMSLNRTQCERGIKREDAGGVKMKTPNDKEVKRRTNLKMSLGGRLEYGMRSNQTGRRDVGGGGVAGFFNLWQMKTAESVAPFVPVAHLFLLANACLVVMPTGKEWTSSSSFIPVLRIKVSGLVMSLQGVVVPQSDSLLWAPGAKPKMTLTFLNTGNHKPPAVSRFLITSPCLFKATLLCNNTVFVFVFSTYGSSSSAVYSNGSLNRDRKGLKAKWGNATVCAGAFGVREQYGNPRRSGQGHKGQSEWRKR